MRCGPIRIAKHWPTFSVLTPRPAPECRPSAILISMPDDQKTLSREDVCRLIMKTPLWNGANWHWFGFHFTILLDPCAEHPFARAIIDALVVCDAAMPGYAEAFIERLAS